MAFFESRSSIGRKLAVVRWFLPLVLALLVVIYETLEHVVYVPEPILSWKSGSLASSGRCWWHSA